MFPHPRSGCISTLGVGHTAQVTMSNPRTGQQSRVNVYAHPADIADAVILFARNQCIRPMEVEISTIWPQARTAHAAPI